MSENVTISNSMCISNRKPESGHVIQDRRCQKYDSRSVQYKIDV